MRLDIKRSLYARSDRVKGIDFHPTEPWVLTTLYSGSVQIWSYETQTVVKSFEVTDVPVRAGRFIARKSWFVVGSDDFQVRAFNYNTGEKVAQFEAHPDYIRAIVAHPTQPFILTASDDMTIKMWNWENNWRCSQIFEGHSHYVMSLAINPKDTNTFASACLDRTVKIWSIGSPVPNFTLEAHETKGVNFVDYYPLADKPYLITTSDDRSVKIWDYQTKSNIATLEGHTSNVSFAIFHQELPLIISGAEDATVKYWNSNTFKLEQTVNYGLERVWCVSHLKGSNGVAMGFDEGSVVIKIGREEPAVSMDPSGKIVWARHSEIVSSVIRGSEQVADGEIISLPQKELGSVDIYPSQLVHSPNGRFVAVCGDGEYIIYTALAWRNKSFGPGLDFVWAQDSNEYAVCESRTNIQLYKNFKQRPAGHLHVNYPCEQLFGGTLLGIKGADWIGFFDWDSGILIRRIDVVPNNVYWSDSGDLVVLACQESFYVLRFSKDALNEAIQSGQGIDEEEGVEETFQAMTEIGESVRTGRWVGDCFIYTNSQKRLNYLVGDQTYTISHFDVPVYLVGYIPKAGRVYVADRDVNVSSYELSELVLEYQTCILRGDFDYANQLLKKIPSRQYLRLSRFLQGQNLLELALEISPDYEHKFDLALQLGKLDLAVEIANNAGQEQSNDKWRLLGDAALNANNLVLAQDCFEKCKDLSSLLLIYTSTNNLKGLQEISKSALENGLNNIAFSAKWAIGDVNSCVEILWQLSRYPEATLLSSTYNNNGNNLQLIESVKKWKDSLNLKGRKKIADSITQPMMQDVDVDDDDEQGGDLISGMEEAVVNGDQDDTTTTTTTSQVQVNGHSE